MRLISNQRLKATKENRLKNDCPLECDKNHCDVCQFRDHSSKSIPTFKTTKVTPDIFGREIN